MTDCSIATPVFIKAIDRCKQLPYRSITKSYSLVFSILFDSFKTLGVELIKFHLINVFDNYDKVFASPAVSALHIDSHDLPS
jgi:hypothetical protein